MKKYFALVVFACFFVVCSTASVDAQGNSYIDTIYQAGQSGESDYQYECASGTYSADDDEKCAGEEYADGQCEDTEFASGTYKPDNCPDGKCVKTPEQKLKTLLEKLRDVLTKLINILLGHKNSNFGDVKVIDIKNKPEPKVKAEPEKDSKPQSVIDLENAVWPSNLFAKGLGEIPDDVAQKMTDDQRKRAKELLEQKDELNKAYNDCWQDIKKKSIAREQLKYDLAQGKDVKEKYTAVVEAERDARTKACDLTGKIVTLAIKMYNLDHIEMLDKFSRSETISQNLVPQYLNRIPVLPFADSEYKQLGSSLTNGGKVILDPRGKNFEPNK